MSLKRKVFNIFAAAVMIFGSIPTTFLSVHAEGETSSSDAPQHSKTVTSNGDGTYNITLSVTGKQESSTDVSKANVVIVFDTSNSMEYGTSCTVDNYYTNNDTDQYGYINSDQTYRPLYRYYGDWVYGTNHVSYDGTHYNCVSDRLTVAKNATTDLISKLLANNSLEGADNDTVEISLVNFATSVRSTTSWSTNETTLKNTVNGYNVPNNIQGGTNWETALSAAKTLVDNRISNQPKESNYVIFVSDGDPTFRDSRMGASGPDNDWNNEVGKWGTGSSDPHSWNYNAAKAVADTIAASSNTKLYAVGAFGNVTNMQNLAGSSNYYEASNQQALENAFKQIVDQITNALSLTNVKFTDGITALTTAAVSGNPNNFTYTKGGTTWADAPEAEITTVDGVKTVIWDLGDTTLKNGETATVSFTVWPSQKSYDLLADLNNGKKQYSDLTDDQKASIVENDGVYSLQTNTEWPTLTYSTVETVTTNGVPTTTVSGPTTIEIKNDGPMPLDVRKLTLEKKWEDDLDPSQREEVNGEVVLNFYKDKNPYEEDIKLTKENHWKLENYIAIAPGVMISNDSSNYDTLKAGHTEYSFGGKKYIILETGHDYYFEEEDINSHFELTNYTYHPMIIDNVLKNVVFTHNIDGDITGIEGFKNMNSVSATNTLKGGILVGKTVINNGSEDTTIEDEYEITITLSEETGVYRIYTYNPDGSVKERSDEKTYTGGEIKEKIKVNQKIRVQDMPTGTTYEVTETLPNGYTRNKVDYTVVMYDGSENKDGVKEVFGNASAQATVTNYLESGDLIIKKTVTASSGNLTEAQKKKFGFTINFYEHEGDATPIRVDDTTCNKKDDDVDNRISHNGTCTIKNIPAGWYYEIVEDVLPGFNNGQQKTETGTIKQGNNEETFNNNYAVTQLDPDEAKIVVNKAFASGYEPFWIASDQFVFVMTGNGESVESKPLTLSGSSAEFKPVITDAGTYTYTITEKTTDADGNSLFREGVSRLAEDEDIIVTIIVEDKGDGTLGVVSKTYSKASQTIYNIYEGDNTYGGKEGELEFTKDLTGRDWRSTDEFNFTISSADADAPMPKETTITADKDHKTVGFGKIKFTNKDVGNTYTYTVTESFDVPSVEATGTSAGGISLTVEVKFNNQTGKIDLVVSDYEDTFTNEYKTTSITAAKVWDDDEDRDGLRKNYKDFFVAVKNDEGKYVAYEALSLEDKDDYSFSNLPEKNAEGEAIEYTIVEASTCSGSGESIRCTEFKKDDDYIATVENNVITNFHEPELYNETGELTVKKIWADEGNNMTIPGSVSVDLLANGEVIRRANIVAGQNNEWTYTFSDLYMNDGGEPITYSVQESAIGETAFGENESVIVILTDEGAIAGSWTKSVDNEKYEITNTWKESSDEIIYEGAKKFNIKKVDENYKPMAGVTFAVEGADDRQTDANGMTSKSVPVSKTEKEDSFEFVVSEKETLDGYDLVEGSATVAVSCTSELTGKDFNTLVNTYTKTCEFTKSGSDKYVWNAEDLTLTVVNKRSLAKSLTIKKTVKGLSAEVLTDLEFTIKGPEDFGENSTMTLKVSEDCTITNDVITCRVEGKVPTGKYTVTESNADVKHFELIVSGDNDVEKKVTKDEHAVFEITNEYEVEKTMYYVDKVWEDAHDKDGKRPEKLTIKLLANGEIIETVDLTMKDAYIIGEEDEGDYETGDIWSYVWEELPYADEKAEVISYTAEEVLESDDYEQLADYSDEYRTTFVNYHEPEDDPCAAGGCGGDIIPPMAPETGKFTGKRGGGKDATVENSLVMGGAIVMAMFIGMPMLAVAASRRKK